MAGGRQVWEFELPDHRWIGGYVDPLDMPEVLPQPLGDPQGTTMVPRVEMAVMQFYGLRRVNGPQGRRLEPISQGAEPPPRPPTPEYYEEDDDSDWGHPYDDWEWRHLENHPHHLPPRWLDPAAWEGGYEPERETPDMEPVPEPEIFLGTPPGGMPPRPVVRSRMDAPQGITPDPVSFLSREGEESEEEIYSYYPPPPWVDAREWEGYYDLLFSLDTQNDPNSPYYHLTLEERSTLFHHWVLRPILGPELVD